MSEEQIPKVLNTHHFGSIEKLPSSATYIGRPSAYGNAYSSKSGIYSREECIALHRIDLYKSLIKDPGALDLLKQELCGHDLACWCTHPKKIIGCHGDNFLHVLYHPDQTRLYDKSVVFYLMDDLRRVLKTIEPWILKFVSNETFLFSYLLVTETHVEIENVLHLCRVWKSRTDAVEFLLAQLVIDLELANRDTDLEMIKYRLNHVSWVTERFITGRIDRSNEPISPSIPLKRKKKDVSL